MSFANLIAAIRSEIYGTYREQLELLLRAYRPTLPDTRVPAIALTALIDGLWLELSLGNAPFTPEEAETLAERWLASLLD